MSATVYPPCPILMVDDEPAWLRSMAIMLERLGGIGNIESCSDSREVMTRLASREYSLVLLDNIMPHRSGMELLPEIVENYPSLPVIMLTGINQVDTAVACIKSGAFDYFVKTSEDERLVAGVQRALRMQEIAYENRKLRDGLIRGTLEHPDAFRDIVTENPRMRSLLHYAEAIAGSSQPVLITGESGVGKELVAKAIHQVGRPKGPWVAVNIAGLDDTIFADTLFGHARGAFTDADHARPGLIDQARGGTLFLDEIGSLNLDSQAKLLRVLQDGEYYPLGSDRPKRMLARVVVATNEELAELQQQGKFRKDLFFRLRTHHLHIPPLRERNGDLRVLTDHFLAEAAAEFGKVKPTPPRELDTLLRSYDFPGNVRELRSMVYDAVAMHRGRKLSMDAFKRAMGIGFDGPAVESDDPENGHDPIRFGGQLPTLRAAAEALVEEAMRRADGNQGIAASMLGISRPALNKRLKKMHEGED
ncbi:sigma-54-dependent transcriptional regulator [Geothermobacter hydrogeniphilus]|uniref:Two-component system response regulator n=1 Tax=Geothermobacter hydrogeniphilus TaxID=1969733 RepID=A0A1X0XK38_9BACT|nr:sigma-54 dependent transcriptional regulator [Geothermobacter hydrogeniphilus]ORJ53223.1 two-component system response regulator [Geothermobacter hydrogeniphilus]